MVDSCFKIFRKSKCLEKTSSKSPRDSFDNSSLFMPNNEDKFATIQNHKSSLITSINDNESQVILRSNNKAIIDHHCDNENEYTEFEDQSILRPHNRRKYLYSTTSTTASNDILSSDEDNETLDILYPLHNERCFGGDEDAMHAGGTMKILSSFRHCLLIIFYRMSTCFAR